MIVSNVIQGCLSTTSRQKPYQKGIVLPPFQRSRFALSQTSLKFDQIYRKIYQHLQHQISFTRFIITHVFILYIFDAVDISISFYKVGQTYRSLT